MELQLALKDEHFCPVHLLSALLRDPQLQSLKLRLQYPDLQKCYFDHVHSHSILVVSRELLTTGSAGYSPWGRKELDTTEQLSMHTGTTGDSVHTLDPAPCRHRTQCVDLGLTTVPAIEQKQEKQCPSPTASSQPHLEGFY